jgi:hypothetical protein
MLVTRTSIITGVQRTYDMDITQEQLNNYERGMLIDMAFANLDPKWQEFIKTGITQEEWDKYVAVEEEEEEEEYSDDDEEVDQYEP